MNYDSREKNAFGVPGSPDPYRFRAIQSVALPLCCAGNAGTHSRSHRAPGRRCVVLWRRCDERLPESQADYHLDRGFGAIQAIVEKNNRGKAQDTISRIRETISNDGFEVAQIGGDSVVSVEA